MLYALRTPSALLALITSFLVGVLVQGVSTAVAARSLKVPGAVGPGRTRPDLRRHLDPFGTIAAALAGAGWALPAERPGRRRGTPRYAAVVLAGPLANLVLAALALAGFVAAGGGRALLGAVSVVSVLHGSERASGVLPMALLALGVANLAMGILALVPLPPLPGGRLLFAFGPRSHGWQRAEHFLDDQHWGVGILLALLLIPLAGQGPLLLALIDDLAQPLLRLAAG